MEQLKDSKILKLTIKKKWFDMILSGDKKEEYREICRHWESRLCSKNREHFKNYDFLEFSNGYGHSVPKLTCRCEGISVGTGNRRWGCLEHPVFIISLGEITNVKNLKK